MARTEWKQTNGKVTKIEAIYPRGRLQLIVRFSYEVQGHLFNGVLYTFKSMQEGDSLEVRYDATNPKVTEFDARYRRSWRIWWSVMATILVGAFVILLWARATRQ